MAGVGQGGFGGGGTGYGGFSGGTGAGPTPWWQTNPNTNLGNLTRSAPPGYTFDPVKGGYTQTIGSAPDVEQQAGIQRGRESTLFNQGELDANTRRWQEGDLYKRFTQMMSGLGNAGSGSFGSPTIPPPVQFPGGGAVTAPDTSAANAASFAAAKSKAGAMARSSVNSLASEMADRGILGSGTEARGLTDRLAGATNALSDENVAELNKNVEITQHAQDLAAENQRAQYSGAIGQRAEDINAQTQRRGQDIGYAESQQNRLNAMLAALGGMVRSY